MEDVALERENASFRAKLFGFKGRSWRLPTRPILSAIFIPPSGADTMSLLTFRSPVDYAAQQGRFQDYYLPLNDRLILPF